MGAVIPRKAAICCCVVAGSRRIIVATKMFVTQRSTSKMAHRVGAFLWCGAKLEEMLLEEGKKKLKKEKRYVGSGVKRVGRECRANV